ncbi:unnamed protein product [Phaedon cochleariae]|uniref:Centrobin n=1 Tax=Phaedon cochleariae TaxID=80249 RepID=A0A9P0GQP3_PHACE|nr:unnamed protein product [Phaedon cochleariae]
MSDTDDTDDLLLIPPDFFVLDSDYNHSAIIEPYYNIVDNLISKVNNLQNRITSIESSDSLLSNSVDFMDSPRKMHSSVNGARKYNSIDDLYTPSSTQSTPQKPPTKLRLNSLPASPNVDKFGSGKSFQQSSADLKTYKIRSPQKNYETQSTKPKSKEDSPMLNEIDSFLSKVKTIQRLNAVRNLEFDLNACQENQRDLTENNIKECEEISAAKVNTWQSGDRKESVPDLHTGVRDILYQPGDSFTEQFRKESHLPDSSIANNSASSFDRYPLSDSSTDSTQVTAYKKNYSRDDLLRSPLHSNALSILNVHKQLQDAAHESSGRNRNREHKQRSANTIVDKTDYLLDQNLGLLKLADIWSTNSKVHLSESHLSQKLQEEKLRRLHCEDLIQDLQNRNLELQQKLTVAVNVDETKNKTIQQFQEALEKIVMRLEKLNKEKHDHENEMSKLKRKHSQEMENAAQKLTSYEKEVSNALTVAHENREKYKSMENKYSQLQNEAMSMERTLRDLQVKYNNQIEKNEGLSKLLDDKEAELIENKNNVNTARSEISQSRKAVEICQAEVSTMKKEHSILQSQLSDLKEEVSLLNDQKKELLAEVASHKKREMELNDELSKAKKQIENNKLELRNFYQGQVEILVQNKLKEFQSQLDQAEMGFKGEIKKREMSIAKTAASHIQQISEKYSLEIKLLEKKHQEEIKLYNIQIMQHKQQAENVQSKLDQIQEKRVQIAKQLQKIMESQWTEALRIISSGKSPTLNDESAFNTIDQLNSLKTRSYNNVEEVLAQQQEEHYNITKRQKNGQQTEMAEFPLGRGQEAFSLAMDTPVSSRNKFSENDIQKYINLLLNRHVGNPTQDEASKESEQASESHDRGAFSYDFDDASKDGLRGLQKEKKIPKPPWK